MKSFHKLQVLTLLIIITFFFQHSHASRALLKDKSNEMVGAGGNPGKAQLNVTEGKTHKVMANCEESYVHHDKAEECHNSATREIEDSDYIYTNSTP
ncbi:hypothetical protein SUGI_1178590 [Cryptomeria japonica]|nr:hypothetical protein SUGI_1178590 [Cryptomeria japonica]